MENIIKSSPYTNFDIQRTITNRLLSLSKGTHTPKYDKYYYQFYYYLLK